MRVRIKRRFMRDLWDMTMQGMGTGVDRFKKDLGYRQISDKEMDMGTEQNLYFQSTHILSITLNHHETIQLGHMRYLKCQQA